MPPKKAEAPKKLTKKQREALANEQAMAQATADAQRLFKFHERERRSAESTDKGNRDAELFGKAMELDRVKKEADVFQPLMDEYHKDSRLAIREYKKLNEWDEVMDVTWLPSVESECDIRAFVEGWRKDQSEEFDARPGEENCNLRVQFLPRNAAQLQLEIEKIEPTYVRTDCGPDSKSRKKKVDHDLGMCVMAVELANSVWRNYDKALVDGDKTKLEFCREMLILIYSQIIDSLDLVTVNVLQYTDVFIPRDEETMLKSIPKDGPPTLRFGLWAKNIQAGQPTRNVNNIRYPDIGISIDPREAQIGLAKLPKALYDKQGGIALPLRVLQLTFDPFSVLSPPEAGQLYYALDCIIVVESLAPQERVRKEKGTDWSLRVESGQARRLVKQQYPPPLADSAQDYTIKVTFEVPENVVIRHRTPKIGKWNYQENKWDPVSSSNYAFEQIVRKCSFLTSDLTAMAVIQEKGFDVPYENWQLFPLSDDEVLFVLEGRRRGESSDREVKILVQDAQCKLMAPEEKELAHLRNNWMPPATLLRLMARAGYNFILQDSDADPSLHTPSRDYADPSMMAETGMYKLFPKTKALEAKGYQDLVMHCSRHAIASTRHNKRGEDVNMTLFRISKERRTYGSVKPFITDVDEDENWHSVRYERDRCVLASFKDSDDVPDLSNLEGKETHLNLHNMLAPEYEAQPLEPPHNHLLEYAVMQLLTMTRPFTWG